MIDLPIFITGNKNKAKYLSDNLDIKLDYQKLDLDEIQSLNIRIVAEHKVKQAYSLLQKPVLVEDVSLEIKSMGKLPGIFIKWFLEELGNDGICNIVNNFEDKSAIAKICYCLYDGKKSVFFESSMDGSVSSKSMGNKGFGWDQIFIKKGHTKTRAQLTKKEEFDTSMRREVYKQLKEYFKENNHE